VPFSLADVVFFILVLGIAVTVHEWGHFFIARRVGVRVDRFSIGFGPPLLKIQRGETEYCIAPIPLGGYVKMAGESYEDELKGEPWEFLSASPWRRIAIVFAGPAMNLVLAAMIFFLLFFLIGREYTATRELGDVIPGSLGASAGLEAGDVILAVDGEPADRWADIQVGLALGLEEERAVHVRYERAGAVHAATLPIEIVTLGEGDNEIEILKEPPVLEYVDPVGSGWAAGLQRGDRILSVSGEPVQYWHEVYQKISKMIRTDESGAEQPVPFHLSWRTQEGELQSAEVVPLLMKMNDHVLPKVGIGSAGFGLIPAEEPVVGKVKRKSPAAAAGIEPGDRIVLINDEPITYARRLQEIVLQAYEWTEEGEAVGKPLDVTWVTPEDETRSETIQPSITQTQVATSLGLSSGRKIAVPEIGIQLRKDREKFGLIGSLGKGLEETGDWCLKFYQLFRRLITREYSVRLIGGPIAIAQGSASQARWGVEDLFRWIAILSANLAVINLFPIPILDGGHILFCLIEVVRKKRLSVRTIEWAHRLSFFLFLLPLIIMIFYIDIDRLGWFDPIKRWFE